MWIVKNRLRATLSLRGLDVSIAAGEQFDLDTLGRERAERSNQVQVAFEEGYLENVFKASAAERQGGGAAGPALAAAAAAGVSAEHFDARLEAFKQEVLSELRTLPRGAEDAEDHRAQFEELRAAISGDMKELVGELKLVRERFATVKGRIAEDPSLSEAEVKARLAFLDEQERQLLKNFETVGKRVEQEQGDVVNMADLLADL